MLSMSQTAILVQSFIEGAKRGENVGGTACLLNLQGHADLMTQLFTVRGFKDLLKTALPESQHGLGHLSQGAN